jgi:hypothetical protein
MTLPKAHAAFLLILAAVLPACEKEIVDPSQNAVSESALTTADWSEASHGNGADPNYLVVFPQDKVNTLEIAMTAADWQSILANMQALYGYGFGSGGNQQPGGTFPSQEPDYVAVSVTFNGKEWYKVGFRLKGNSTLSRSWRQGIYKLPFRLNFDRFEDEFPEISNQRFYGFKELSLSCGANDNSLLREKIGSDIFRAAGVPCAQTAFYKVFIDFGSGSKYCGIYTVVEVVDDTLIKNQFGSDDGNIYKPESSFRSFIMPQFEKKNNEEVNDYSDVQQTISILNSGIRSMDPPQWRTSLSSVFNTGHFLKWLAVNTTIVSWDTYGRMAHNYYLYNLPGKGLTWIPWDNNECMLDRQAGPGGSATVTLPLDGVTDAWPLIRYLADDPVYYQLYKDHVKVFAEDIFLPLEINAELDRYHNLIAPYVIGPEMTETGKYTQLTSPSGFTSEWAALKNHVVARRQAALDFVN